VTVHLASFKRNDAIAKKGMTFQGAWLLVGLPLLRNSWLPGASWRVALLRIFGAKIGDGVLIKTGVRVKYPWRLHVGNHCWIGEDCWIDNMADVTLGNDVCLSQGCYLCTGNHNWNDPSFGMYAEDIVLESGSWVASRSVIGPGVVIGESAIAAIGSVVWRDVPAGEIHGGNPATFRGTRDLTSLEHPSKCKPGAVEVV
jgi:putative colanic acid biosynthesis acetyltransferase WcaF